MKKFTTTTAIFLLIILAACTPGPTEPVETTRPSVTTGSLTATPFPTTAVPIQPTPTNTPPPTPTVTGTVPEPNNLALYDTPISDLPTRTPTPTPTPTPEPTNTVELQPFIETDVPYVIPSRSAEIYTGPGSDYDRIDYLAFPDTAQVTGQSLDGEWWRILCPDGTIGNCWVFSLVVAPVSAPTLDEIMPDPATLELSSETIISSPDGRWTATASSSEEVAIADFSNLYYVKLTITDGTNNWTPVAEWRGNALDLTPPRLITWSADSRYLYYTQLPSLDGCYIFVNGYILTRVDITDGSTQEILPSFAAYNLSISPDTAWIAFMAGYKGLYVKQLEPLGDHRFIPFTESNEDLGTYEIYWSADNKTVVLTITSSPCHDYETTSIVRIDIETWTLTTLIASDRRRFVISEWPDPTQPLIRLGSRGSSWWLNIDTGELTAE